MSNRKKNINRDKIYDYTTESTLDMNLLLEVWKVFWKITPTNTLYFPREI